MSECSQQRGNLKDDGYISLSDIAKYKDGNRSDYILQNWMRNRSTIEFIGLWEQLYNPDFNSIEFDGIKQEDMKTDVLLNSQNLRFA
ncbi:KilA-N domain-containing protein [Photorhabdus sp. P32]|uniref:KilA-N domain-containing protein n=1 Tax=Photorhabdus sp. P32 TaxID=3117549 RepID=UPI00311B0B7F